MITEATDIILSCTDNTLEGIAQRAIIELQKRNKLDELKKHHSVCNQLIAEIETGLG